MQKSTVLDELFNQIGHVTGLIWQRGWAERNGGNFSLDVSAITDSSTDGSSPVFTFGDIDFSALHQHRLLISGTGCRMRDIARLPRNGSGIIEIDADTSSVRVIKSGYPGFSPTSELATHVRVQSFLKLHNSASPVVLHIHPTYLLALTHLWHNDKKEQVNRAIWSVHPEAKVFIPEGIGFVPYTTPGTVKLAEMSIPELKHHRIILWERHGCLAAGDTLEELYDLIDIVEKAAKIYLICRMAGTEIIPLNSSELENLARVSPVKFNHGL